MASYLVVGEAEGEGEKGINLEVAFRFIKGFGIAPDGSQRGGGGVARGY